MRAGQCDRECRPDLAAYNATKLLERFGTKFHSGLIQWKDDIFFALSGIVSAMLAGVVFPGIGHMKKQKNKP